MAGKKQTTAASARELLKDPDVWERAGKALIAAGTVIGIIFKGKR